MWYVMLRDATARNKLFRIIACQSTGYATVCNGVQRAQGGRPLRQHWSNGEREFAFFYRGMERNFAAASFLGQNGRMNSALKGNHLRYV
jgi:hypothetical protein